MNENQEPTALVPASTSYFQIDLVLYGKSYFDLTSIFYSYQAVKNLARLVMKSENGNQFVFHLLKNDRNLEYLRLYDMLVFVDQPRIKKIQLKAVPEKGEFTLLLIPYLTIPKAFFLAHGKRKFTEQLSSTRSFNVFASHSKKQKLSATVTCYL